MREPIKFNDDPYYVWYRECDRAREVVDGDEPECLKADMAIEQAERLLALARILKGVGCKGCGAFGHKMYSSTATWAGGIGGQSLTVGVCDTCWGTGRTDKTGPDLRRIHAITYGMEPK